MALKVGELYATLGLDTAKYDAGLNSAGTKLSGIGGKLQTLGGQMTSLGNSLALKVTAPILALSGAILGASYAAGKFGQGMEHMSQATGVSTDQLQKLRFVAGSLGIDFESVGSQIIMLQRKLMGIEADNGMAAKSMADLGVSVTDSTGNLRSMNDLFPEVISKLQGMESVTQRNALASQLFGRNMADLAPILGLSTAKMAELESKASVMSESQVKAAAAFQMSLNILQMQLAGIGRKIGIAFMPLIENTIIPFIDNTLVPAIKRGVKIITDLIDRFAHLPRGVQIGIAALLGIVAAAGPVISALGGILGGIGGLIAGITGIIAAPEIAAIIAAIGVAIAGLIAQVAAMGYSLYYAYTHSKEFRESVNNLWTTIKTAFGQIKDAVGKLMTALQPLWEVFKGLLAKGGQNVFKIWSVEIKLLGAMIAYIADSMTRLVSILTYIGMIFEKIFKPAFKLAELLTGVGIVGLKQWQEQSNTIKSMGKTISDAAKQVTDAEAQAVLDAVQKQMDAYEQLRQKRRDAIGFGSITDVWQKAMVAGARSSFDANNQKQTLTTQNLPGAAELKTISESLKKQERTQADLLSLTRDRLGVAHG